MRGSEYRMRYLPIFLDLQTGPVLLVGAGELVRAKPAPRVRCNEVLAAVAGVPIEEP